MDEQGEVRGNTVCHQTFSHITCTSTYKVGSASSSKINCSVNNHVFRATEIGSYENIKNHGKEELSNTNLKEECGLCFLNLSVDVSGNYSIQS